MDKRIADVADKVDAAGAVRTEHDRIPLTSVEFGLLFIVQGNAVRTEKPGKFLALNVISFRVGFISVS